MYGSLVGLCPEADQLMRAGRQPKTPAEWVMYSMAVMCAETAWLKELTGELVGRSGGRLALGKVARIERGEGEINGVGRITVTLFWEGGRADRTISGVGLLVRDPSGFVGMRRDGDFGTYTPEMRVVVNYTLSMESWHIPREDVPEWQGGGGGWEVVGGPTFASSYDLAQDVALTDAGLLPPRTNDKGEVIVSKANLSSLLARTRNGGREPE